MRSVTPEPCRGKARHISALYFIADGSGTLSPAAMLKVAQGAFVVDEYASQALRLTGVRRER